MGLTRHVARGLAEGVAAREGITIYRGRRDDRFSSMVARYPASSRRLKVVDETERDERASI
jgi:hypothetical protein